MKLVKIVTTIPPKDADKIRKALGDAGAGVIGNYVYCSTTIISIGRFIPKEGAHPNIGEVGKPEEVGEERIEVTCNREKAKEVIEALRKAHPYEEPIIDIYPMFTEEEL